MTGRRRRRQLLLVAVPLWEKSKGREVVWRGGAEMGRSHRHREKKACWALLDDHLCFPSLQQHTTKAKFQRSILESKW